MHRIQYAKLTPEPILGKLAPAANGPASASPLATARCSVRRGGAWKILRTRDARTKA